MWVVVDRIEGAIAVFVADDGSTFERPAYRGIREGMVFRLTPSGVLVRSRAEERRRISRARAALRRLRARDPGGDVRL